MLIVTICVKNYTDAFEEITKALLYPIDGIELRLDYFTEIKPEDIKSLKQNFNLPMIFTLRKKSQGGFFISDEQKRLQLIKELIVLKPDYFDLEYDVSDDFIKELHAANQTVKLISSYHNFDETPGDLDAILKQMHRPEFYGYKIATQANSTLDTLRMLNFVHQNSKTTKITGICMGKLGEASRILAPVVDGYFNFTCIERDKQTTLGQLEIKTLMDLYNYKKLNTKTSIYALLGDPVGHSIGHIFHNKFFKDSNKNAIYLKLQLKPAELEGFFIFAKKSPFKGFSVTMPLKENVLPYLDELDDDAAVIKAVNTIVVRKDKYVGYNTDGIGALNAIEQKMKVKDKKIVIIGAGGTAKAIVYEAIRRGGQVIVLNRTVAKAKQLAANLGCQGFGFEYFAELLKIKYDILINATSVGMKDSDQPLPIPQQLLSPGHIVLDMVYAHDSVLLKVAAKNKCTTITGKQVFVDQALAQQLIWFNKL